MTDKESVQQVSGDGAPDAAASNWPTLDYNITPGRTRVVVLGSGWAAISFVKALTTSDSEKYDVTLISPRNYFLYTPLLPAVATGTIEDRSIVEPVRRIIKDKASYYEAVCEQILPEERSVVACFPKDVGFPQACFKVKYDILVVAVGSVNNTFGCPGVREFTFFFKGIRDAVALRRQISECFERASLPHTTHEERQKLLSFVIVGGGPTGVEVAAEMHDMIRDDLSKMYTHLMCDVNIRLIELQDHVLSTYDRAISMYTQLEFGRSGIECVLNTRVAAVRQGEVTLVNSLTKEETIVPFGACVWATGVAMHPLVKQLAGRLPEGSQGHFRSILTDEHLRVLGSNGTIYGLGDGATVYQPKSLDKASELFDSADKDGDGSLNVSELTAVLQEASLEYSHLAEHAQFLSKMGQKRWGGMVGKLLKESADASSTPVGGFDRSTELSKEEFQQLLTTIDAGLRALPATAQVAQQQGKYMAKLVKAGLKPGMELPGGTAPFKYGHKGSLAYVGNDNAVMDVPSVGPITGRTAGLLWKSYESVSQFSFRNVCLVSMDWLRTKIFGRDISRV